MNTYVKTSFAALTVIGVTLLALYVIPWDGQNWGQLEMGPSQVISVSGTATQTEKNQIAQFDAGVSALNDNKETAVNEVNQAVNTIIQEVKNFGIAEEDIKTQNLSIYQSEEPFSDGGRQTFRAGQWRANNSITIKLRDVEKANDLAALLTKSGATNVYGPNFSLDMEATQDIEADLLSDAVEDARAKAEKLANSSGGRLGKVVTINEGGSSGVYPMYAAREMSMGGGGAPDLQAGSQQVSKSVQVTFELLY